MGRRRRILLLGLVLLVLAGLVWVAGPGEVLTVLGRANLGLVALGAVGVLAAVTCKSIATTLFLASAGAHIPPVRGFLAYAVALVGKLLLPMGRTAGVFLIAYTFDREVSLNYDRVVGSVSVSEFLNGVAGLLVAGVGLAWLVVELPSSPIVWDLAMALAVVLVVCCVLLALLWVLRRRLAGAAVVVVDRLHGPATAVSPRLGGAIAPDRIRPWLDAYLDTLSVVTRDRRAVATGSLFLVLSWAFFVGSFYVVGLAVDERLSIGMVAFLVPAGSLVSLSPLPGGLGTYEVGVSAILVAVGGISLPAATTVTLLYRLCSYWFVLGLGSVCLAYSTATLERLSMEAELPPGD